MATQAPSPDPDRVCLVGHGLPARWQGREHFVIVVTHFGQGEDVLATWAAWRADPMRCDRLTVIAMDPAPQSPGASGEGNGQQRHQRPHRPHHHSLAPRLAALWPPMTPGWHHLHLDDAPDARPESPRADPPEQQRLQHLHLMLGVGEPAALLPRLKKPCSSCKPQAMWAQRVSPGIYTALARPLRKVWTFFATLLRLRPMRFMQAQCPF